MTSGINLTVANAGKHFKEKNVKRMGKRGEGGKRGETLPEQVASAGKLLTSVKREEVLICVNRWRIFNGR